MSRLQLWTGLPGSGRRLAALAHARHTAHSGGWVWWITDQQPRADKVERDLLREAGDSVLGIETLLAGHLPQRVLALLNDEVDAVPPDARRLALSALLLAHQENGSAIGPGWASRAARVFADLQDGSPDAAARAQRLQLSAPWLAKVLSAYRARVHENGQMDEAELGAHALARLADPASPHLPAHRLPDLLVIDRMPPPSPVLDRLLRQFARHIDETVVLLDDHPTAPALARARDRAAGWREMAGDIDMRQFTLPAERETFLAGLFAGGVAAPAGSSNTDVPLPPRVVHHRNPREETRAVLRAIARAIRIDGRDPASLAIVAVTPEPTRTLLREAADGAGVRLDIHDSEPLSQRPLGRLVLDLLAVRMRGWDASTPLTILLHPLVHHRNPARDRRALLALDDAARERRLPTRARDLERGWLQPLRDHVRALRDEAKALALHPDEGAAQDPDTIHVSTSRASALLATAEAIERAARRLQHVDEALQAIPDPATVDEIRDGFQDLLLELGVPTVVHATARDSGDRDERTSLARLAVLWRHLERAARLRGAERLSLDVWLTLIQDGLRTLTVHAPSRLSGGVPVLSPDTLRGHPADELHVLGLTGDAFPGPASDDPTDPWGALAGEPLVLAREQLLEMVAMGTRVWLHVPVPASGEHAQSLSPLIEELLREGAARMHAPDRVDASDGSSAPEPNPAVSDDDPFSPANPWLLVQDLVPALATGLTSTHGEAGTIARKRLTTAAGQRPGQIEPAHLLHAVAVEHQRQNPTTLTRYEGQLAHSPLGEVLGPALAAEVFSASRLDRYAACPMRYFQHDVLGLRPFEHDPDEDMAPDMTGRIVHDVLAEIVLQLRRQQTGPIDLSERNESVQQAVHSAATAVLDRMPRPGMLERTLLERVLAGLADDSAPGHLHHLLQKSSGKAKKRNPLPGEGIVAVEAGFGFAADTAHDADTLLSEPLEIPDPHGGPPLRLRGRIDRIGDNDDGWRIWDYKTGDAPPAKDRENGLRFQLPIYIRAVQAAMETGTLPRQPISLAGYIILKEDACSISGIVRDELSEDGDDPFVDRIHDLRRALISARFHHPLTDHTSLCPRKEEHHPCPFLHHCRRDPDLFALRDQQLTESELENAYLVPFQQAWKRREATR